MTEKLKNELSELIDPHKNKLSGVLGLSSTIVKVTNRPGFVWVRLLDNPNEAIQAHNSKVAPWYDMPVFVSFDGVKYNIDGVDVNRYPDWGTDNAFYADHAEQHSMMYVGGGGGDVVWVDSQQFIPLLVLPIGVTGSSYVHVANYVYKNVAGNYLYVGSSGTWVPPSPSASQAIIQVVAMRDSDGAIYTKAGNPFSYSVSGTSNLMSQIPTALNNANDIALAAILRTSSVSGSIITWDNILDVRQFYGKNGSGGGVSGSGASYFKDLLDVPNSYYGQHGKVPIVNAAENGLEFTTMSTGTGGVSAFTSLTDTPGFYSGSHGKFVRVNSGETGLEFASVSSSGTGGGGAYPQNAIVWADQSIPRFGGSINIDLRANHLFGFTCVLNTVANGDILDNSCVLDDGVYTLKLLSLKGHDFGTLEISIDGVLVMTADLYAASTTYNVTTTTTGVAISAGRHVVSFKTNGKNAASDGYEIHITRLEMTPTSYS